MIYSKTVYLSFIEYNICGTATNVTCFLSVLPYKQNFITWDPNKFLLEPTIFRRILLVIGLTSA